MKTRIRIIIMLLTIVVTIISFFIIFINARKENTKKGTFVYGEEYVYEF